MIGAEQNAAIGETWASRAAAQGLKPGTKRYDDALANFIAGASMALHHTDPDATEDRLSSRIPPMWVIGVMTDRNPFTGDHNPRR